MSDRPRAVPPTCGDCEHLVREDDPCVGNDQCGHPDPEAAQRWDQQTMRTWEPPQACPLRGPMVDVSDEKCTACEGTTVQVAEGARRALVALDLGTRRDGRIGTVLRATTEQCCVVCGRVVYVDDTAVERGQA